jgi:Holliday junction resolvase-like predicted endonuclease
MMMKTAVLIVALALLANAGCRSRGGEPAAPVATAVPTATTPAASAPVGTGFEKLAARWLREDGGYILEIRSVSPEGKADAAYYNPRPINVAKAEAFVEGGVLTVFVELRAPNYPGSTYRLVYDASRDQLVGTYFQAMQGQTFDVSFVRR